MKTLCNMRSGIQIPSTHIKPQQGKHAYNPSTEEQKQAGKPNTNGKLSFKAARQKVIQEDTWHSPLVSSCTPIGTCTYTCTCMQHTHTLKSKTGEMGQLKLIASVALAEDPVAIWWFITIHNSSTRGLDTLFWLMWAPDINVLYIYTCKQTSIYK